ncbi:MAG: glycerol-3-phosphate 1-O-acyltransferase PlsY [Verrucomicrobiae bacterium]|nr:glycerol-3-phosphate 1-O-acyltransferase PlsY [Verrucomicrobiae bacterium]
MNIGVWVGCAVAAYLLGSIPTGYLWCRARGVDIRTVGSGNIGATNVMRALGKPVGVAVLLIDAAKGFVPVSVAPAYFPQLDKVLLEIVCAIAVVAGHNWTCWLRFRGGKGVATSAGALLAMLPGPLVCALGVWLVVFALWRYVSLASIAAAAAAPVATWLLMRDLKLFLFTFFLGAIAIYRHRSNIRRLLAGTENRFGAKKA